MANNEPKSQQCIYHPIHDAKFTDITNDIRELYHTIDKLQGRVTELERQKLGWPIIAGILTLLGTICTIIGSVITTTLPLIWKSLPPIH